MVRSVLSDLSVRTSGRVTENRARGHRPSALFLVTRLEVSTDKSNNTQRNHASLVFVVLCTHAQLRLKKLPPFTGLFFT